MALYCKSFISKALRHGPCVTSAYEYRPSLSWHMSTFKCHIYNTVQYSTHMSATDEAETVAIGLVSS